MAQKSEEIMPDPDAIIPFRRDRLLCANLTGCDVNICWMIQIQKKCQALWSAPPPSPHCTEAITNLPQKSRFPNKVYHSPDRSGWIAACQNEISRYMSERGKISHPNIRFYCQNELFRELFSVLPVVVVKNFLIGASDQNNLIQ